MVKEKININHFKKISTAVDFFLESIGVVSEIHMRIFVPGFIILFLKTDFVLRFLVLFWLLTCVIHVRTNVKEVFALDYNPSVFTLTCLWCITMVSYLVSECGETSWRKGFMKYRGMLQNTSYVTAFLWSQTICNFSFTSTQAVYVFYSLRVAFVLQVLQYLPKFDSSFEYNRGFVNFPEFKHVTRRISSDSDSERSQFICVSLTRTMTSPPKCSIKVTDDTDGTKRWSL